MGAGILLISIHNGRLFFLFGKENKYADTPGYADFGGGVDDGEELLETAIREFTEETTGFWGSAEDLKRYINTVGSLYIDLPSTGNSRNPVAYRTYIVPVKYSPTFEQFYNNNHAFLEEKLPVEVYRDLKIFEKSKVVWATLGDIKAAVSDAPQKKKQSSELTFRPYYVPVVKKLIDNHDKIFHFVSHSVKYSGNNLFTS